MTRRVSGRAPVVKTPLKKSTDPDAVLPISDFIEVICCTHLSSYVESPFRDRGGVMVVGPPSVFKSTIVGVVEKNYNDAVEVSDMNTRSLNDMRDQIAAKVIRTLVVPDYGKLYERHPSTSSNVEGTVRALVGEGFSAASFEDSRIHRLRARCTVLGAMVPKVQSDNFRRWEETGFSRRFLWPLVRLHDPDVLERAVEQWQTIDFHIAHVPPPPHTGTIVNLTTRRERSVLRGLVKYQPGGTHAVQLMLLVKVLAVLKWWYKATGRTEREAMRTLQRFGTTLGREGAEIVV